MGHNEHTLFRRVIKEQTHNNNNNNNILLEINSPSSSSSGARKVTMYLFPFLLFYSSYCTAQWRERREMPFDITCTNDQVWTFVLLSGRRLTNQWLGRFFGYNRDPEASYSSWGSLGHWSICPRWVVLVVVGGGGVLAGLVRHKLDPPWCGWDINYLCKSQLHLSSSIMKRGFHWVMTRLNFVHKACKLGGNNLDK